MVLTGDTKEQTQKTATGSRTFRCSACIFQIKRAKHALFVNIAHQKLGRAPMKLNSSHSPLSMDIFCRVLSSDRSSPVAPTYFPVKSKRPCSNIPLWRKSRWWGFLMCIAGKRWRHLSTSSRELRGSEQAKQELIQFCKQRLTTYKVPRSIVFHTSLPKSLIGKPIRRELLMTEEGTRR